MDIQPTKPGASFAIVSTVDVTQKACFFVETLLPPKGQDLKRPRSNVSCINDGDPAMVPAAPNDATTPSAAPSTSAAPPSSTSP
jgi:hypothetical protein